jgi:hypothetical protein
MKARPLPNPIRELSHTALIICELDSIGHLIHQREEKHRGVERGASSYTILIYRTAK